MAGSSSSTPITFANTLGEQTAESSNGKIQEERSLFSVWAKKPEDVPLREWRALEGQNRVLVDPLTADLLRNCPGATFETSEYVKPLSEAAYRRVKRGTPREEDSKEFRTITFVRSVTLAVAPEKVERLVPRDGGPLGHAEIYQLAAQTRAPPAPRTIVGSVAYSPDGTTIPEARARALKEITVASGDPLLAQLAVQYYESCVALGICENEYPEYLECATAEEAQARALSDEPIIKAS